MSGPRYWNPEVDGDDVLWVCEFCGAELHSDCVGEECPACGEHVEDEPSGEVG